MFLFQLSFPDPRVGQGHRQGWEAFPAAKEPRTYFLCMLKLNDIHARCDRSCLSDKFLRYRGTCDGTKNNRTKISPSISGCPCSLVSTVDFIWLGLTSNSRVVDPQSLRPQVSTPEHCPEETKMPEIYLPVAEAAFASTSYALYWPVDCLLLAPRTRSASLLSSRNVDRSTSRII